MRITIKDVEHIAQLSRLTLSADEKETYLKNLNDIIEHADKLKELDTSNVEPTHHVLPVKNVFREDERRSSMEREKIMLNAPDHINGCFRVPKIVE